MKIKTMKFTKTTYSIYIFFMVLGMEALLEHLLLSFLAFLNGV